MIPTAVQNYAHDRKLTLQDAVQIFLQVIVLKHLSAQEARFMGGTALVFGYGNPRFSEDIDLGQVQNPGELQAGLSRSKLELEGWFSQKVRLTSPTLGKRTWRLSLHSDPAHSYNLHVDTQPYLAYTKVPIVIEFPSISPFVVQTMELNEIMAEKILALAYRRYLSGRDLFDLWFHWLKNNADPQERFSEIKPILLKKLKERKLRNQELRVRLSKRLNAHPSLDRAKLEWKRYLTSEFQSQLVFDDIVFSCTKLRQLIL